MRTLIMIVIWTAGLLLSGAVFASEAEEEGYYYDESCEICPALAAAHESHDLYLSRQAFSFDLSMVLALMEEKLNLAVHLASVAAHPLWPHEEDLALYVDQLIDLVIYREDDVSPRKVDTVSFLLQCAHLTNPYVEYAVPLERSADYYDAHRNLETYMLQAYGSLDACREDLALGDPDMAFESMQRAYAALLAAQGHAARGLASGLRTMIEAVEPQRVMVRVGESIQEVVDRLEPGGTILLEPGIYHQSIVIDKSLSIVGASTKAWAARPWPITLIDGSPTRTLIQIGTAEAGGAGEDPPSERITVTIRGLELRGGLRGIEIGSGAAVSLTDVVIDGAEVGLMIFGDAAVTAESLIIRSAYTGLFLAEDAICSLTRCRIESSTGSDAPNGAVFAWGNVGLLLDDCDIVGNDTIGVFLIDAVQAEIRDSRIEENGGGLVVMRNSEDGRLVEAAPGEFLGSITGCGNAIPGPGESGANSEHGIYPEGYEYLLNPCPGGSISD